MAGMIRSHGPKFGPLGRTAPRSPRVHAAVSIALMGTFVWAADYRARSVGPHDCLALIADRAFGLHGWAHLAGTVVARNYTPGAETALALVIPYYFTLRQKRRLAGSERAAPSLVTTTAVSLGALYLCHAVALVADAAVAYLFRPKSFR